jgi:hypothetical protein
MSGSILKSAELCQARAVHFLINFMSAFRHMELQLVIEKWIEIRRMFAVNFRR